MKTTVSSDRRRELCAKIVGIAESHGSVSTWRNIQGYSGWNLKNLVHDSDGLVTAIELGIESDDFFVMAHTQGLIDAILHSIAEELARRKGLFDRQIALRNEIEMSVIDRKKVAPCSVPRNRMRDLLACDRKIAAEIEEKKMAFDELLATAKELGFEVFELDASRRFYVYRALEVSYAEIVNDMKIRQAKVERSSASSSLPPA
ncbi:MAG: hypothetical protein Q7S84_04520 [bacterium]|nr:hypothetical protein [bacterium]